MAEKGKTTVRRIKATDDTPKKASSPKSTKAQKATKKAPSATKTKAQPTETDKKIVEKKQTEKKPKRRNMFVALAEYFKGAWYELKQVRWPTRSATWGMTAAVLVFTLLLATLILLLDTGFNWLFEQIL